MRIGLIACSARKLNRPAEARELYSSPLFQAARAYCEATYDQWYILSAKHGLVSRFTMVEPYDVTLATMTEQQRRDWYMTVIEQMANLRLSRTDHLFIHAGELYRGWGRHWIMCPVTIPLVGLRIGQQLAWYKAQRGTGSVVA